MAKEYKLNSIVDLLNIPDDRLEACCAELPSMIRQIRSLDDLADAAAQEVSDGLLQGGVQVRAITWVDDNDTKFQANFCI